MSVQQSIVNGFISRRGLITYSMLGSRNGADGTGDCSGIVSQVLKEAGIPIQGLPSTVTLGQQLANNGFYRISINQPWDAQPADIILMSWGADMSTSGGAGGHVGAMIDDTYFISCDYSTQAHPDKLSIPILGMTTMAGINQLILRFGGMLIRHLKPTTKRTQPYNQKTRPFTKRMRSSMSTVCGKSNVTISRPLGSTGPRTVFPFQW